MAIDSNGDGITDEQEQKLRQNNFKTAASSGSGSGWAVTGTTTLTGDVTIDQDGNDVTFNGNVVIKNRVSATDAFGISSTLNSEQSFLKAQNATGDGSNARFLANTTDTSIYAEIVANFNDGVKVASITATTNAVEGIVTIVASEGIQVANAIPSYANNAAAVIGIGAGKLYYTDVAGEYIVKMSH